MEPHLRDSLCARELDRPPDEVGQAGASLHSTPRSHPLVPAPHNRLGQIPASPAQAGTHGQKDQHCGLALPLASTRGYWGQGEAGPAVFPF